MNTLVSSVSPSTITLLSKGEASNSRQLPTVRVSMLGFMYLRLFIALEDYLMITLCPPLMYTPALLGVPIMRWPLRV